ncbi:MAG: hypothetical protein M0Z50_12635 [Planctomycetia bacterium]|nr:hypothetical protein [Planctomycetia bacterium]
MKEKQAIISISNGVLANLRLNRKREPVLTFTKDGKTLVSNMPWNFVVRGSNRLAVTTSIDLNRDDLDKIEMEGWDFLVRHGVFPMELEIRL